MEIYLLIYYLLIPFGMPGRVKNGECKIIRKWNRIFNPESESVSVTGREWIGCGSKTSGIFVAASHPFPFPFSFPGWSCSAWTSLIHVLKTPYQMGSKVHTRSFPRKLCHYTSTLERGSRCNEYPEAPSLFHPLSHEPPPEVIRPRVPTCP